MTRLLFLFKLFFILVIILGLLFACSTGKIPQKGILKDIPDILVEKKNTWRGGPIGAALGNPIEGKINELSLVASREAGRQGKAVAYLSQDGFQRVEAFPVGKGKSKNCSLIREQLFQEGQLIRDEIKEICP